MIIIMPRFFQSLASPEPEPDLRSQASSSLGHDTVKLDGRCADGSAAVVVNFSWDSLLEFVNDQLTIKLATGDSKPTPRLRPNYDNRKRRFMAARPPERRSSPS